MTLTGSRSKAEAVLYSFPPCGAVDLRAADEATLLRCLAPVFSVDDGARSFNRIGAPSIEIRNGREHVFVDPDVHLLYAESRHDRIGSVDVIHLVYRIHFTLLPFTWRVFYERHRNAGLVSIVTVDAVNHEPLFFTTVYSCGCYRALLPTRSLPREVLPDHWPSDVKKVWGKPMPAFMEPMRPGARYLVAMDSRTHRVHDMRVVDVGAETAQRLELRPMEGLRHLTVAGGGESSFFYPSGLRKGHVKGAWSPIEGLTFGLLILDPMIGSDKDFGDPSVTGTRFYTMLLPWDKNVSRLDVFEPLLRKMKFHPERMTGAIWR